MQGSVRLLLIGTSSLLSALIEAQAPGTITLVSAQRRALFDDVWTTIDRDYYSLRLKSVDWAAVRARYSALPDSAATDSAFYAGLTRMLQELHDLHTTFVPPTTSALTSGLGVSFIEGHVVIVRADSVAMAAGARIGMRVRAVGDENSDVRRARIQARLITSSSERANDLLMASAFLAGRRDAALPLDVEDLDGRRRLVTIPWHSVLETPTVVWRRLSSGIAYVRFAALKHPADADFARVFDSIRDARGLIIDLRGNTGGDMKGVGLDIASRLVSAKTDFGRFIERDGKTAWFKSVEVTPRRDAFAGRLVILIDGGTRSAGEVFANGFQEAHRATIVGATSCGCVFDIKTKGLPGGGRLVYSHLAFRSKFGRALEGEGVSPDVRATPTARGLREGRDEGLEAAERVLKNL